MDINMELRRHQDDVVIALELVKEVCMENNIEFFLIAGSTLGAVRHEGFIPWDDDIDIGMTLKNIKIFNEIMQTRDLKGFKFLNYTNYERYPRFFAKITYEGRHCVDIFPLVKTSNNRIVRRSQWILKYTYFRMYMAKISMVEPKNIIKKGKWMIMKLVATFFSREQIIRMLQWNESRFENKETKYYINLYSIYSMSKELINAEWIENPERVLFEGEKYLTFGNTHDYLTHLYGDYMILPPEDERFPTHEGLKHEFELMQKEEGI